MVVVEVIKGERTLQEGETTLIEPLTSHPDKMFFIGGFKYHRLHSGKEELLFEHGYKLYHPGEWNGNLIPLILPSSSPKVKLKYSPKGISNVWQGDEIRTQLEQA